MGDTGSGPVAIDEAAAGPLTRSFTLVRDVDETGISGTGLVAWGVAFPDGVCVTRWCSNEIRQTCVWASIDDLRAIHGHNGHTRIVFDDGLEETDRPGGE